MARPDFHPRGVPLSRAAELRGAFLDRWIAEGQGDRLCIIGVDESLTYRQLQARVNRICNVLVNRLGLKTGNRVLLRAANSVTMAAAYLAVLKAGGIVVATMPLLRAREIAYPLNKAKIALALCDHSLAGELEGARALAPGLERIVTWGDGGPDSLEALCAGESDEFEAADTAATDVCLIAFTSGTTGEPKGTMHFHRDMLAICDGFARQVVQAGPDDRFLGSAPFAFTFGLAILLFPMRIGAVSIVLEKAGPDDLARAVARFRATSVSPRRPPIARCSRGSAIMIFHRCAAAFRRARRWTGRPSTNGSPPPA